MRPGKNKRDGSIYQTDFRGRMESKKFDCVEMKRRGAESVYKKVAGLSKAEQLRFWRAGNEELRKIVGALAQKNKRTANAGK